MKYNKIPLSASLYLRLLRKELGLSNKELYARYPQYAKRSIARHAKLPVEDLRIDKRKNNPNMGRPRKLSKRSKRKVISAIGKLREYEGGVFTSVDVQDNAGIAEHEVSNRTVRRALNQKGYGYLQCRKKGQLTPEDVEKRYAFAKRIKRLGLAQNFFTEGVSFYLDGVGWAHKRNPKAQARSARTRTWRKKSEGLSIHCTAKGKKEGTGGNVVRLMVAIGYGSGVLKAYPYDGHMNGELFAQFVRNKFPEMFRDSINPRGKYFVQDNDPSQNSRVSVEAMEEVGAFQFKIPPRSPDLNPIENMFHLVGKKLRRDARLFNIENETLAQFTSRIKKTLLEFPRVVIDKTIASMNARIDAVIESKGQRTKY